MAAPPPNPAVLASAAGATSAYARAGGDPSQQAPYQNVAYGNMYGMYAGAPPANAPPYAAGYPPQGFSPQGYPPQGCPPQGQYPGVDPYTGQPMQKFDEQVYGKAQKPFNDYAAATPGTQAGSDIEAQQEIMAVTENLSIRVRHGFVRKVYVILALQLLVTFGIALCFSLVRSMRVWVVQYWWVTLIAMIAAFIVTIAMTCFPSIGKRVPLNFFLLTFITLCYSLIIGFAAALTTSEAFAIATGITWAVTVALTIFACQTKWDFTGCGVYIFVLLIVLIIFGIVCAIVQNRIAHIVYGALGALIFSFILIYDTQLIVGGKHRTYQYSIDDYIFAALTLYLDVINLFLYILTLTSAAGGN